MSRAAQTVEAPPEGPAGAAGELARPGRRRKRRAVLSGIAGLALIGAVLAVNATSGSGPAPPPPAPRFSLPRLGGGAPITYPSATYRGHGTVLILWASWCVPCQKELPAVARVVASEERAGTPVRFLGVDDNDTPSAGLAFARRAGVGFPSVEDEQLRVASELGLTGQPDTVFVTASGKVVHIVEGPVSPGAFRHWVSVLAHPSPG